jgi:hypothetical protein
MSDTQRDQNAAMLGEVAGCALVIVLLVIVPQGVFTQYGLVPGILCFLAALFVFSLLALWEELAERSERRRTARAVVSDYYQRWRNDKDHNPTREEVLQADRLLVFRSEWLKRRDIGGYWLTRWREKIAPLSANWRDYLTKVNLFCEVWDVLLDQQTQLLTDVSPGERKVYVKDIWSFQDDVFRLVLQGQVPELNLHEVGSTLEREEWDNSSWADPYDRGYNEYTKVSYELVLAGANAIPNDLLRRVEAGIT